MSSFQLTSDMKKGLFKNTNKANVLKNIQFETKLINLKDIQRNEKNFYELSNIDELAEDIKMNSLYHNILVRELPNSKYELISGERRFLAYNKLFNNGDKNYSSIPCKIVKLNDEDAEILLIEANALTRTLSDREKLLQVEKLNVLYKNKKDRGEKIPGRIQKHIANSLGMSESSVGRLNKINSNLISSLKNKINEDKLSISNANTFASLSEDKQEIVNKVIEQKQLTKEEAITLKNKLNEIDDTSINQTNNLEQKQKSNEIDSIIQEFTESKPKTKLIHTKELDLNDKINKINNLVLKLTKDLDRKNIINLIEGANSLELLKDNLENLFKKIEEKQN